MHMYYLKIKGVLGMDKPCVLEIEKTDEEKEEHRCRLKFTDNLTILLRDDRKSKVRVQKESKR